MPENDVIVLELHAERRVRKHLHDFALLLDRVFFGHSKYQSRSDSDRFPSPSGEGEGVRGPNCDYRVGKPPLKFALRNRLSYCWDIMYACTCVMKSIVTTTMISSDVPPK
jgi:hypothetical protein